MMRYINPRFIIIIIIIIMTTKPKNTNEIKNK